MSTPLMPLRTEGCLSLKIVGSPLSLLLSPTAGSNPSCVRYPTEVF